MWYRKTFEIFLRFVCQTTLTISVPYENFFIKNSYEQFFFNLKVPVPKLKEKLETIFDFSVVLK